VIVADKRTLNPDGSVSEKFPWWGSPSLSGDLRITGKRLDKVIKRRVTANIQGGGVSNAPPGSHFWSTGITFPTTGAGGLKDEWELSRFSSSSSCAGRP
jgi:hypothetical protein